MKIKLAAMLIAALSLSACQTKPYDEMTEAEQKKMAAEVAQRCIRQGHTKVSAAAQECLRREATKEVELRDTNRENAKRFAQAMGQGFSAYGSSMSQGYDFSPTRRPVNCTSSTYTGNPIYTTCY
ncbi:hypothetical protein [Sinorhizobium chiapasense]|uniref:Lipoprotein n=1 Tax=Sinorhizobium chiapasense TaxID=501572 RepID=A0ABZ2BE71_9HYPH